MNHTTFKRALALCLAVIFVAAALGGCSAPAADTAATGTGGGQAGSPAEAAGDWPPPDYEFTIMVGFAPGGGNHSQALIAQKYFERYLGCRVTIQNVPGASGLLGFNKLYTMDSGSGVQMSSTGNGVWTLAYISPTDVPWTVDEWRNTGVWSNLLTSGMAVSKDAPWDDFADLIEDARSRPDEEIVLAAVGPGRSEDLLVIELMEYFGVKFKWVFYDSSSTLQTDILTGDVDVGILSCTTEPWVDHPEFKTLTGFIVDWPEDYEFGQYFPTMRDWEERLGYRCEDLPALWINDYTSWVLKADTPDYMYDAICEAVRLMCEDPEFQEEIAAFKVPMYMPPAEADPIFDNVVSIIEDYVPLHQQYVPR